ncbi:MAG: SusD/RagB family nutrient-binding outer membrane lipoprotein [Bacteroidota bacterium]|nr:SusD/RagB family nutrient-binding outer membrane lipoprotein [Candidatus Kapabacteria bacterium]MDW8220600.1 SusD/RagB family nutrient-binding outer membrane lipoprotein [Bacteroidota bacterium]
MKSQLFVLLFCAISTGISACDAFLDVNRNPNFPEDASPAAKLPSIIANGLQQQTALSVLTSAHFTQHVAGRAVGNALDQFFLSPPANPFNDTYFRAAGNIPSMIERATREQAWHYVGAGKVLMAALLFHLTDLHGNIPYTDAFRGAENFQPKYDSQESIYAAMDKLLDEAIVEFGKTQPVSAPAFNAAADILYGGNVQRWIRFAFGLKARQYNHLTKKASYNPQRVLEAIDRAVNTNADDAQVAFSAAQAGHTNFWGYQRGNANARTFGRYFINMLDGTILGIRDPRYIIICPDTNRSKGAINGSGQPTTPIGLSATGASDFYGRYTLSTTITSTLTPPGAGVAPAIEGWYSRTTGVQLILTNAEMRFVEAEAAFRANNRERAYNAFRAGITAHMDKLGVPAAERNAYLASRAVPQSAAELTLAHIMQQKYIAMFLHHEAWVDMRRYDYSPNIYPNFAPPTNPNPQLMGAFPRRFLPGSAELLYNRANAYSEIDPKGVPDAVWITTPVWWDKP